MRINLRGIEQRKRHQYTVAMSVMAMVIVVVVIVMNVAVVVVVIVVVVMVVNLMAVATVMVGLLTRPNPAVSVGGSSDFENLEEDKENSEEDEEALLLHDSYCTKTAEDVPCLYKGSSF